MLKREEESQGEWYERKEGNLKRQKGIQQQQQQIERGLDHHHVGIPPNPKNEITRPIKVFNFFFFNLKSFLRRKKKNSHKRLWIGRSNTSVLLQRTTLTQLCVSFYSFSCVEVKASSLPVSHFLRKTKIA